jgi:hypothetical protein
VNSNSDQNNRYKLLAFLIIRDAIGFFFGIPKFFESLNIDEVIKNKLNDKIKDREITDKQKDKYRRLITKSVNARIAYLQEDYEFCKDVLFTKNIWLELLNIDPIFFETYLNKMSEKSIDELAIVPNWTMRDESLRRPYLNAELNPKTLRLF